MREGAGVWNVVIPTIEITNLITGTLDIINFYVP